MSQKYYVYSGCRTPDNYKADRPIYSLKTFDTSQAVATYRKEFDADLNDECEGVIFRVIEGRELVMKPKEVVTDWELG